MAPLSEQRLEFAITPAPAALDAAAARDEGAGWQVVVLATERGAEVVQPLARFGHRQHAEAFLDDLLAHFERP